MARKYKIEEIPDWQDVALLEFTEEEKDLLAKPFEIGQLEYLLPQPAFRRFMLLVKQKSNNAMNEFFSGREPPKGISDATSYYQGIVSVLRWVLSLPKEEWRKLTDESQAEPAAEPVEPEADRFGPVGSATEESNA